MNAAFTSPEDQAFQLISCERELLTMRRRQARLVAWLDVAQKLAKLINPRQELWEGCIAVSREILASLEVQRSIFLEVLPAEPGSNKPFCLRSIVDPRRTSATFELSATDSHIIAQDAAGLCNDSSDLPSLALPLKLHRFMWYLMQYGNAQRMLFVAGFDAERAPLYVPFDSGDFGHFKNTSSQLELLFGNLALARDVRREQEALRGLNTELEQRVADRTRELLVANAELGVTLNALRDKERLLADDIEQARLFQMRILPALPVTPEVEFGALYRPLEQVGGDIFDVCALNSNHYRVFLADATGHGVQASMRTILLKTEYDRIKKQDLDPGRTLHELTCRLYELFPDGEIMCTGCCVDLVLDAAGATVSVANAANPPLLHHCMTGVCEIYNDGSFLGIDRAQWPNPTEFRMAPGDKLLCYSDGLSEQANESGQAFEQRLHLDMSRTWRNAAEGIRLISEDFDLFVTDTRISDDVTAVAIRLPG